VSVFGIEKALYELGVDGSAVQRYRTDKDLFLTQFILTADETRAMKEMDLATFISAGANPLLVLGAYRAVGAGESGADDMEEYMARVNAKPN
jgi:hypothetical protein